VILLPLDFARIHCYFDDIVGFTFSEYTGERLAITEFNNAHQMKRFLRFSVSNTFCRNLTQISRGATRFTSPTFSITISRDTMMG
jgi:hypothetical protein